MIAQTSNLSRSLFKASETPPNLVLLLLLQLVLFSMHSSSASKLFVKILKRTGPNSEGLQNPTSNLGHEDQREDNIQHRRRYEEPS